MSPAKATASNGGGNGKNGNRAIIVAIVALIVTVVLAAIGAATEAGATRATVAGMGKRIDTMASDVGAIKTLLASNSTGQTRNEERILALTVEVNRLRTQLDELQKEVRRK